MSDFEAKSGRVAHFTDWGSWSQTVQDVTVEVFLEQVKNNHTLILFEYTDSNMSILQNVTCDMSEVNI